MILSCYLVTRHEHVLSFPAFTSRPTCLLASKTASAMFFIFFFAQKTKIISTDHELMSIHLQYLIPTRRFCTESTADCITESLPTEQLEQKSTRINTNTRLESGPVWRHKLQMFVCHTVRTLVNVA
jgi:hypothetical protein